MQAGGHGGVLEEWGFLSAGKVPCALLGCGMHWGSWAGAAPEQHGVGKGFGRPPRELCLVGVYFLCERAGAGDVPFDVAPLRGGPAGVCHLELPSSRQVSGQGCSPAERLGAGQAQGAWSVRERMLVLPGEPGGGSRPLRPGKRLMLSLAASHTGL